MKSPAFQFYSSDWLSSRSVRLMDAEQRGWYIQLLAEAWESQPQATLPSDDALLRVLAGVNTSSTSVEQRWTLVKKQFKRRGSIVYNERQMEEVVKQEVNRKKKSAAGKASAEARRVEREAIKAQHLSRNDRRDTRSTPVEIRSPSVPTDAQRNSTLLSSSSIPISPSEKKKEKRADKPPDPRVQHPAIQAVWKIRGRYPLKELWDMVIETVGDEPDVERMKKCWVSWRGRGFSPENYGWLTDWYINGEGVSSNGTQNQNNELRRPSAAERNSSQLMRNLAVVENLRREGRGDSN